MDSYPLCEFDSIRIFDHEYMKLKYMESIHLKFDKQSLNTQDWSIPLKLLKKLFVYHVMISILGRVIFTNYEKLQVLPISNEI